MRYHKLLTGIICLISVFVFVGAAEAGLAWFGFSNLCFEGTFKAPQDTSLTINLPNFNVIVRCENINSADPDEQCQPGEGNGGSIMVTVPTTETPDKEKGVVYVYGCIPLDKYDDHDAGDHEHSCLPLTNTNKIEIIDTAHVEKIETTWELRNKNDKIVLQGYQTCYWDGFIDPETCEPSDEIRTFRCVIDEEFKK